MTRQKKNNKKIISLIFSIIILVGIAISAPDEAINLLKDIQVKYLSSDTSSSSKNETEANASNIKIHFIDTGNSDAILIESEKTVLIDGAENDDEKILPEYIKSLGIDTLDYVIATHVHADHIGALDSVIDSFKIGQLFASNGKSTTKTYTDYIEAAARKGIYPSVPLEGTSYAIGHGAYIQFFNTKGGEDTNNESLVTLLVNGSDKALFTGDIEKVAENRILKDIPQVDLLKVAHHGSSTSSSDAFLDKVNPKYAVITCGAGNSYGHPHKETLNSLNSRNIEIYRTDKDGTVTFISTGKGFLK